MTDDRPAPVLLIAGAGGALLIASLFMPWAEAGGVKSSGWELLSTGDVLFLLAGLTAIAAALTRGRYGLFRPDMSMIAAADLLAVAATLMLAWLALFSFPEGAGRELGVWLALLGAFVQMMASGDYSLFRGAPVFPAVGKPDGPAT